MIINPQHKPSMESVSTIFMMESKKMSTALNVSADKEAIVCPNANAAKPAPFPSKAADAKVNVSQTAPV